MVDRSLLHFNDVDAFADWMGERGWERAPTKSCYEVLRLVAPHGAPPIILYARYRAKEHVTVQGQAEAMVRRYLRQKKAAEGDQPC
ncbi:MAG: hypothetical protein CMH55_07580 [Myxococcales bacterium]|nr:hypothetical protein [Myxococcales bacterium]|tara:strand:- start:202 stop:459 length:258 start_codon:yes stop_codon:yes gene_type:complete